MTDVLVVPDLHKSELPVFRRKDALDSGLNDRAIGRLVKNGDWVRLRHGGYTDALTWSRADEMDRHSLRTRVAMLQANTDVVASHVSALPEFHSPRWGLDLGTSHLTRRDRRAGRSEAGLVQHRGLLLADDVVERRGIAVTSGTKTAIDVTTVLGVEQALVQVNHLLHAGHTTPADLQARVIRMEHDPFTLRTDLVLRLADALVESVFESRTYFLCWRYGIPCPQPQHQVFDQSTLVARLDFAWPDLGCWLKCDGRGKYLKLLRDGETPGEVMLREKQREDLVRRLTGWRCLRITWAELSDPARLAAKILRFLAGS